ncbi:MAG: type II toxin-antitoxin system YafQ family toxin [Sphingobacterium sp.]|uniref:type II toxin-antitoxin system YafQ family toxin n=1 Tax=Sphingobacterium sp. JB170 TaxID=1434842 RepID=UPI000B34C74D
MTGYKITYSGKFKKDFKKYQKRPRELKAIIEVLEQLRQGAEAIPKRMKPHRLIGDYKDSWECHVFPDLLLIWDQDNEPINEIHLIRVGSHSELF